MRKTIISLAILAATFTFTQTVQACTDIHLQSKDGAHIIARTLEFAMEFDSQLVSTPRGMSFTVTTPNNKPGKSWKNKIGYVYVNALKQLFTVDGMNEQGLTFEYLYLPGLTQYQSVPAGKDAMAIPYTYLGDYLLGNCATLDEVRAALKDLYVYQQTIPGLGDMVFPLHAAIHDASGKGIVVEFINGNMVIHDYKDVMTNSPTYDWHLTNLLQYLNLSPYNPAPIIINGVSYGMNGQGAGMIGLPGDVSPASRFVKMAFMLHYANQADTAFDAVNLARHIINNVDIPIGIAREKTSTADAYDYTQWTVFKDQTNKIIYFTTYDNLTLRAVDMKKLDLSEKGKRLMMPLASKPTVEDVTAQMK